MRDRKPLFLQSDRSQTRPPQCARPKLQAAVSCLCIRDCAHTTPRCPGTAHVPSQALLQTLHAPLRPPSASGHAPLLPPHPIEAMQRPLHMVYIHPHAHTRSPAPPVHRPQASHAAPALSRRSTNPTMHLTDTIEPLCPWRACDRRHLGGSRRPTRHSRLDGGPLCLIRAEALIPG